MKIAELASLLGGTINGSWINIPGPGHRSKDRSLGVKFDRSAPDGFRIKSFAGDPPAECRRYVKDLLAGMGCCAQKIVPIRHQRSVQLAVEYALTIWTSAFPAEESLVERYLSSRACSLTPVTKSADALRFHPFCPFGSGQSPAMVALMRHVITDEPTGIHRTALPYGIDGLTQSSQRSGHKRMLGAAQSAAVKLQPHDGVLGIAEGIETAISASQLFKVPVWALLSAAGVKSCPLIPGVKRLMIFADHDEVGIRAAEYCARRYSENGVQATVRHPSMPLTDYNDLQQERRKRP